MYGIYNSVWTLKVDITYKPIESCGEVDTYLNQIMWISWSMQQCVVHILVRKWCQNILPKAQHASLIAVSQLSSRKCCRSHY